MHGEYHWRTSDNQLASYYPNRMSKQQPSKPAKKGTQRKKDESGPAKKDGTGTDKEDERDLTTVLDESQRADLTLLIADASESMRKLLVDNFDAGKPPSPFPRRDDEAMDANYI